MPLDEKDEDWDPDNDKIGDKLQKNLNKLIEKQLEDHDRMSSRRPGPPPPPLPELVGYASISPGPAFRVTIRGISNGFIMNYFEASGPPGYPLRFVEVFVKDADDAIPYLRNAMTTPVPKLPGPPSLPCTCLGKNPTSDMEHCPAHGMAAEKPL